MATCSPLAPDAWRGGKLLPTLPTPFFRCRSDTRAHGWPGPADELSAGQE